jgi:hypothetical protein
MRSRCVFRNGLTGASSISSRRRRSAAEGRLCRNRVFAALEIAGVVRTATAGTPKVARESSPRSRAGAHPDLKRLIGRRSCERSSPRAGVRLLAGAPGPRPRAQTDRPTSTLVACSCACSPSACSRCRARPTWARCCTRWPAPSSTFCPITSSPAFRPSPPVPPVRPSWVRLGEEAMGYHNVGSTSRPGADPPLRRGTCGAVFAPPLKVGASRWRSML